MADPKLVRIGIVGAVIAALCCFTPILVIVLGGIGLAAVVAVLDYVLLPLLAVFVALTLIGALAKRR